MAQNHVSCGIYGEVQGSPPYIGATPFSRQTNYSAPATLSIPQSGVIYHPLSQGILFGNKYCYSIVEILPTGQTQYSRKLATDLTVATLATAAG